MAGYYFIVNPISGRGDGQAAVEPIRQACTQHGLDYELVQTTRIGHAVELARAAAQAGTGVVVAVGGDGTANEVLNGLMQAAPTSTAMGVISVGRGNDLAYGWGIPAGVTDGMQALAANRRQRVDVGLARGGDFPQGRYFGNGIGIGFDAVVGFVAARITWLSGLPNYLVAALQTVFLYYKAPLVRLEYDDQAAELSTLMVSVMNGRRMGGGFYMAPQAARDDGLLDLCVARSTSKARVFGLIPLFMKGTQAGQPEILTGRARHVRVQALQGSLPAHADGETLCEAGQALEIELLPGAIEIVTG